jgi:cytochrome c
VIALLAAAFLAQAATPSPAPVVGQQSQQEIWDKRCTFCHGADGQGKTKKGRKYKAPNFTKDKWQKSSRRKRSSRWCRSCAPSLKRSNGFRH